MYFQSKLLANFFGQFWVAAIGIAVVPIYVRYLGAEAYGVIGFMLTLQAWISILDLGMTPTVGREMGFVVAGKLSRTDGRRVLVTFETVACAFALLATTLVVCFSGWLANEWLNLSALQGRDVQDSLVVMAFVTALRFLIALYRGAILGLQDALNYNLAAAGFATARGCATVLVVVFVSNSLFAFALAQLFATLAEAIYFAVRARLLLPTTARMDRYDGAVFKRLWRFAAGVSATAILGVALTQIDKLVLSAILPLEEFAAYFLAATLAGAILTIIAPVSTTAFPKLAEVAARKSPGIAPIYHASCQLVAVLAFPMVIVAWTFPEEILFLWTRDEPLAKNAAQVFGALALGTGLNALMQIPYMLQLSHGWVSLGVKTNLISCAVLLPAVYFVVPSLGALGAAYLWIALNLAYVCVVVPVMHRKLLIGETFRWYVHDNLVPAAAAAVIVIVARETLPIRADGSVLSMTMLVVVGSAAVLAAALVSGATRARLFAHVRGRSDD